MTDGEKLIISCLKKEDSKILSLVQRKCYYIKSSGACQAFFSAESALGLGFSSRFHHNMWCFQVKNG